MEPSYGAKRTIRLDDVCCCGTQMQMPLTHYLWVLRSHCSCSGKICHVHSRVRKFQQISPRANSFFDHARNR
jgi:hypothetical protein